MGSEETRQNLYADPAIYDILYSPDTAREIDVLEIIEAEFADGRSLKSGRLWLEPACGTGRYLRTAAGRGRRCVGFDLDRGQIEYARGRKVRARGPGKPKGIAPAYYLADMLDFLPTCKLKPQTVDFAFNPVNSLRHLSSDKDVITHFNQMAKALKPGAVYVAGISLTDYHWLMPEEDLWQGKRGSCEVSQLVNYLPPEPGTSRARIETVLSHLTVTRPGGVQHLDSRYDLHCFDQKQWRRVISRSDLCHLGSYDAFGEILAERQLPYQLEVLGRVK